MKLSIDLSISCTYFQPNFGIAQYVIQTECTKLGECLFLSSEVPLVFLMQRYEDYFLRADLLQSSAKFVQAKSSEKLAYSLPRRRRTSVAQPLKFVR